MNTTTKHSDVMVCVDCYFAHHYGMTEHDGEWFAGESDSPSDRKPLNQLEGFDLADNTDSDTEEGMDTFSWQSCLGCGSTRGGARYRLAMGHMPKRELYDLMHGFLRGVEAREGFSAVREGR